MACDLPTKREKMGCYLLEAGKEGGRRFLSGFEKLSKLSVLNWKYWSKKLQNKITRAVYKKKIHYAAQGVSKYFRCCSSSAHTPVACSRIKQPVRNPATALCPLATASPRTASLFPMNSGSALSCLNHLEEKKKKKKAWGWTQIKFSGSNAYDHRGNWSPELYLAPQGCASKQRQSRSTREAWRIPSPIFLQPMWLIYRHNSY